MSENRGALTKSPRRSVEEEVRFGKAFDLRLAGRLWPFFLPHRRLMWLALATYPVVAVLHLAQPYLIKVAVDRHFVPRDLDGFPWVVAGLVAALGFEFLAKLGQTLVTQLLGQRVTLDLRSALFRRLQVVDLAYVEKNPTGRLMTRVTNDVESLQETFSTGAISLLGDLVLLTGAVAMMLALDWRLTLYAFAVLPVLGVFIQVMRRRAREAFREVRALLAQLNASLAEALSGMKIVQAFGQERTMLAEFGEVNEAYRDANFRAIRYDALTYAVVEALATTATACLLLLGLGWFQRGDVEVGVFVAFVEYLRRFFAPITELSTKYTLLQSAMASAERCVDLLDQEPTVVEKDEPKRPGVMKSGLRFEQVHFHYPGGPPVLRGLDLDLGRGGTVAVVGPTGAGKSTLVKLLCRFYDPTAGRLSLDGTNLSDLSFDALRGRLAVVLQDPYLFDGSLRDNVAFGLDHPDPNTLSAAVERTGLGPLVARLGWDAQVGERGCRLSAGERQLVAFARALAKNPEILVLDEATSSVDPETEAHIQGALEALLADRTSLVIAHRLSTVRRADRIVVLDRGAVVEEGTHGELLDRDGIYRQLHELQFAE